MARCPLASALEISRSLCFCACYTFHVESLSLLLQPWILLSKGTFFLNKSVLLNSSKTGQLNHSMCAVTSGPHEKDALGVNLTHGSTAVALRSWRSDYMLGFKNPSPYFAFFFSHDWDRSEVGVRSMIDHTSYFADLTDMYVLH